MPDFGSEPLSSERVFHLCIYSPLDNILTPVIFSKAAEVAPNTHLVFKLTLNQNTEHQLYYQETEPMIGYGGFRRPEFVCIPLLRGEMVLVASHNHPRISRPVMEMDIYREEHATVALDRYASFSLPWYDTADRQARIAY